jgi:hypothetical protein
MNLVKSLTFADEGIPTAAQLRVGSEQRKVLLRLSDVRDAFRAELRRTKRRPRMGGWDYTMRDRQVKKSTMESLVKRGLAYSCCSILDRGHCPLFMLTDLGFEALRLSQP